MQRGWEFRQPGDSATDMVECYVRFPAPSALQAQGNLQAAMEELWLSSCDLSRELRQVSLSVSSQGHCSHRTAQPWFPAFPPWQFRIAATLAPRALSALGHSPQSSAGGSMVTAETPTGHGRLEPRWLLRDGSEGWRHAASTGSSCHPRTRARREGVDVIGSPPRMRGHEDQPISLPHHCLVIFWVIYLWFDLSVEIFISKTVVLFLVSKVLFWFSNPPILLEFVLSFWFLLVYLLFEVHF